MPLVQILFSLQERHTDGIALPGVQAEVLPAAVRHVKFELETEITLGDSGLEIQWRYATALFDAATIQRLAEHFTVLLQAIAADPEQALYQLAPLSPSDQQQLALWNTTDRDFPRAVTLISMVEAQAARTPHACALKFEGQHMSYAELDHRANRLAAYLIDTYDITPGARIGHCVARSFDMVIAMLAIMKAGGAYVALDAGLPQERLAYMLADSGAPLLLAGRAEVARLGDIAGVSLVVLEDLVWERLPDRAVPSRCSADSLAYVIYTSGSTGRPKGTLNLHRGPCNRIHAIERQFALNASDCVLQKTPLSFDVSVWELFWPLSQGASVLLAMPDGHKDPAWLAAAVQREKVSVIHFVPSMLQMFLRSGQHGPFPSLRYLMTSGEALSPELQTQCIACFPDVDLINHYGPTETGIEVSWWRFNALRTDRLVPIGAPLDNVRLYVLDEHDQQTPIGVAGELHIAGIQVGEGYLNQPQLTAERFIERRIGDRLERLYRTGDRARWLADGQIAYVGRLDNQVKLFGVRFELGEIESQLRSLPEVAECVVMVHGEHAAQRLACYVVPALPVVAEAEFIVGLRTALSRFLPGYILQASGWALLDTLPLSPNGKVDRQALPEPTRVAEAVRAMALPDSTLAASMRDVWARHLGLPAEQISVHDNFFEIGGNSLLSIAVQTDFRHELALEIAVTDLFRYPTIQQLSRQFSAPPVAVAAAIAARPPAAAQARARALQARARAQQNR
jgi:amino acid adenylation domain-containing protein